MCRTLAVHSRRVLDPGAGRNLFIAIVRKSEQAAALRFRGQARLYHLMNSHLESASAQAPETTGEIRILIVDDEACISDLLAEMLRLLGYTPSQCFSPVSALRLLAEGDFHVILSDFRMPQMNGEEFYHKAISRRPELESRFVFLTGDTMSDETQVFLKKYARPHLSKPFDLEAVVQVILDILAQQKRTLGV